MHPVALSIMEEMILWIEKRGYEPCITDTVSTALEDKVLERVSTTHLEARAWDIRCVDWKEVDCKDFEKYFNKKYIHVGALSLSDKKPKFIVRHKGTAIHMHCQLNRSFAVFGGDGSGIS